MADGVFISCRFLMTSNLVRTPIIWRIDPDEYTMRCRMDRNVPESSTWERYTATVTGMDGAAVVAGR
jgi:hypothetical protein